MEYGNKYKTRIFPVSYGHFENTEHSKVRTRF
jgi:hypothetical protein